MYALLIASALAGPPAPEFPPAAPWSGPSEALQLPADHEWATPAERSGLTESPTYEESIAWLDRLAAYSPQLSRVSIGESPEGRPLYFYVASQEGADSAAALAANKRPTVLAQAGIHSGEIDGLDAGMMLLRDWLVLEQSPGILQRVNLLFLPVFSVDGHARRGPHGRINQQGPAEMGWRVTAQNLNLNRDYSKADTPEMQHLLSALGTWKPSLYLDLHVTDGADYAHDITYGWNGSHSFSSHGARWLDEVLAPRLESELLEAGHVPGPLVFSVDGRDPANGIWGWTAGPRYSTGYGHAIGLPTVLLENHSLKPFRRRVLGTRVFLEACVRAVAEEGPALTKAIRQDHKARPDPIVLTWDVPESGSPTIPFRAIRAETYLSPISGRSEVRFTGEEVLLEVTHRITDQPGISVDRPKAYWIPAAYAHLAERLRVHGVELERIDKAVELEVEVVRLVGAQIQPRPFEGRVRVDLEGIDVSIETVSLAPGSVRVATNQPLGTLAALLLEPESPDSYFRWGEILGPLTRIEYAEAYMIEPLAQRWLAEDVELRGRFLDKLATDAAFAADPDARLAWFYEQTPYFDAQHLVYPIVREP